MGIKKYRTTDQDLNYAGIRLAIEPLHPANFNLFPKLRKILLTRDYNPRIHFTARPLANYLKRRIKE